MYLDLQNYQSRSVSPYFFERVQGTNDLLKVSAKISNKIENKDTSTKRRLNAV
jgi:hypothetical protein